MSIIDLRRELEWVKAHPRDWDQTLWFCGTTACLAGHLVRRFGWEPIESEDGDEGYHVTNGREVGTVDDIACRIADIPYEEGQVIWNGSNSLDQLDALVRRLEADQAVYGTLSQPIGAWGYCWTDRGGRIIAAAQRRTSYVRIGGCIRRLDHDSRTAAAEHALASVAGMALNAWRSAGGTKVGA